MKNSKLSKLRQNVNRLNKEATLLHVVFLSATELLPGSVYSLKRKCGKETCACSDGRALHKSIVLSTKENGKTKIRMLKPNEIEVARRLTLESKRVRVARARLVQVQKKLFETLDLIETELRGSLR